MADIQVGLAVRLTRAKKLLSQETVARRMGTARNYILRVEKGQISPGIEQFVRIADAMEVEPSELIAYARQLQREAEA